jgi:Tfp pilus assembly protein PilV
MKKHNKGFTIIEAVIAMLLVAVITGGVFTALMAARRAIIEPSYKEDMAFAAEGVLNELKTNVSFSNSKGVGNDPCNTSSPLSLTTHRIDCRLPAACNTDGSQMAYTVNNNTYTVVKDDLISGASQVALPYVSINITCNRDAL